MPYRAILACNISSDALSSSAWQVNTDIEPLDVENVREVVERGEQGKKTKALWSAYEVAAEQNPLQHFKDILMDHQKAVVQEQEKADEAAARKAEKAAKKEKRKSKDAVDDEDVEMEDAVDVAAAKKPKSKKRKKEATDEEDEPEKVCS